MLRSWRVERWREEESGRVRSEEKRVGSSNIAHKKHNRQSWTVTGKRDRSDRYE